MEIKREYIIDILKDVEQQISKMEGLKKRIESLLNSSGNQVEMTADEIRSYAILEEVYRVGGIVTAKELSDITIKWGRDPRGSAGYFSGNNPSMKGILDNKRALTERGLGYVSEMRKRLGDDWLDRIDHKYVSNKNTSINTKIFIKLK